MSIVGSLENRPCDGVSIVEVLKGDKLFDNQGHEVTEHS